MSVSVFAIPMQRCNAINVSHVLCMSSNSRQSQRGAQYML